MDNTIIYYVISILDPRIKDQWIRYKHNNGEEIIKKVREYIREVYNDSPNPSLSNNEEDNEDDSLNIQKEILQVSYSLYITLLY